MPIWAQHCAVSAYGCYWHWLRFGPGYSKSVQDYKSRERFNLIDWERWQKDRLKQLLKNAADNIPFYQRTWTDAQKKAAYNGELKSLPLLEKEPIRINPRDFVCRKTKTKHELIFHTSGSTGTPIKSIWTVSELRDSLALREARSANWAGVSFKMPRATFSGRLVEPNPNSKGPFYRWNQAEKQVYFSAFHLRPDTVSSYIEALKKHKIQWATGYAFSFYLLAKLALNQKIDAPTLKAIITTSEKLLPEMREIMERVFKCKVYEEYSTVENALFVSECEKGSLHVSPDVAVLEILKEDGRPCIPGETGEVVTTCLMHDYQLLVRYRLGDRAAWSDRACLCGRKMPILQEVAGRMEDVITGPDGRQLVRFHGIFIDIPKIIEGQVIQEEIDFFILKIVASENLTQDDEILINKRFWERLGKVKVLIQRVEKIERSGSGKYKAVVSKVSL